jgi:hypothetical protein
MQIDPDRPPMEFIRISGKPPDKQTMQQLLRMQLIYSICGLVLGLCCIIGDIVLFLRGVTGATSWTASILGARSQISDAAPGAILFIVGLFIVFITRFGIKMIK